MNVMKTLAGIITLLLTIGFMVQVKGEFTSPVSLYSVIYFAQLAAIAYYYESCEIWLYGSSFLQYVFYVWHFYTRDDEYHDNFIRDVKLYGGLAKT